MSRYTLPLLIIVAFAIALGLTWWTLGRGVGPASSPDAVTAEQDIAPFKRLQLNGPAEVVLQAGAQEHVSIETPARGIRVMADVRGDTLEVTVRDSRRWWGALAGGRRGRVAKVTVTYRAIDRVAMAGAVKLTASRLDTPELRISAAGGSSLRIDDLRTDLLRVSGDGALKAELSGQATEQRISISGAAEYDAAGLRSDHARISVSGVGHVVVRVEKTLSASISGAGSVEYYGTPEVKEHVSGVGRVKRREAAMPARHRLQVAFVR